MHVRLETVFECGVLSLDIVHHGHREHTGNESSHTVESEFRRGGKFPYTVDQLILGSGGNDTAVIPDDFQVIQVFPHNLPVQLLILHDLVTKIRIKFIHQFRHGLGSHVTVIRILQKFRQRFYCSHLFFCNIPSHGHVKAELQGHHISFSVLPSVTARNIGQYLPAILQRLHHILQIFQQSLLRIGVHVQMIHYQNIRRLVSHKHGIQFLIDSIIVRDSLIVHGVFGFNIDHDFRMRLMIHRRRLLQQGIFIHCVQFQNLCHFRNRIRVKYITVQFHPISGLEQRIDSPVLQGGKIQAPAVRYGEIRVHALYQLLPFPFCITAFQPENTILSSCKQRAIFQNCQGHAACPAKDNGTVSGAVPGMWNGRHIAALSFRTLFKLCSGIQIDIFSIRYDAALVKRVRRFALYHASVLTGENVHGCIGYCHQSAVFQSRQPLHHFKTARVFIGDSPLFRCNLFHGISLPLPEMPHKDSIFRIPCVQVLFSIFPVRQFGFH